MWNVEPESASASPFTQAKTATADAAQAPAVARHHAPPDAPPAGVAGGGSAGAGSIDDTAAVMSHWADAHEADRGQPVLTGLGGPSTHSDDGDAAHEHGGAEHHAD